MRLEYPGNHTVQHTLRFFERFLTQCEQDHSLSDVLGGHQIVELCGAGRYAICFRVTVPPRHKEVIVLRLQLMTRSRDEEMEAFHTLHTVSHTMGRVGVGPPVLDKRPLGMINGHGWLIGRMRMRSLCTHIRSLPDGMNAEQVEQLYGKIKHMHDLGWMHGDVHQENVLLDPVGNVYLIDFEFAQPTTNNYAMVEFFINQCHLESWENIVGGLETKGVSPSLAELAYAWDLSRIPELAAYARAKGALLFRESFLREYGFALARRPITPQEDDHSTGATTEQDPQEAGKGARADPGGAPESRIPDQ